MRQILSYTADTVIHGSWLSRLQSCASLQHDGPNWNLGIALEQDMLIHIRSTLCYACLSVSAACHVQWQELSAEVEEHKKENLALLENIKRSRQAFTADFDEQRRLKLSFIIASTQLKDRIR